MKPFISFFPLSLFLFFFFFFFAIRGATSQNLINDTCRTCAQDDPNVKFNFCTTSLQAAPASQSASLRGLGMISIRLIQNNITDTRCYIKHLLKDKKWDPYVEQCLNDCFELYSEAIPLVKQAMKYYYAKRYLDANVQVSAVMDAATTCEDGFQERKGNTHSVGAPSGGAPTDSNAALPLGFCSFKFSNYNGLLSSFLIALFFLLFHNLVM